MELVTERLMTRETYARSILQIASAAAAAGSADMTLGVVDGGSLERRIRSLVRGPVRRTTRRARWMLTAGLSALVMCAVIASSLAVTARAQSSFREEMNRAEAAYNRGEFPRAVEHFRNAVAFCTRPPRRDDRIGVSEDIVDHQRPA